MTDRITYCDIVECCKECPRYGDDCDGDKRNDDLISRADAIEAVVCHIWHTPPEARKLFNCENYVRDVVEEALKALPSADAEPTVIRSRTFMPTKDFKEWAKRIREVNPNAVVIPCDAEVVSAEAVQGWIPCSERLPSMRTEVIYSYDGIVSTGYMTDRDYIGEKTEEHWEDLESGAYIEPIAWMPLPKPYREESEVEE